MCEIRRGTLFHESQDFADLRGGQVEALPNLGGLSVGQAALFEHLLDLFQCPERGTVTVSLDTGRAAAGDESIISC